MAGDTGSGQDADGDARSRGAAGHRAVPHTADVRVEAWGPGREQCLAEAVRAMVETFADLRGVRPTAVRCARIDEPRDDDLLAALLDEIIFRLEVHGEVPVDIEAETTDTGLDVRLAVADLAAVEITGAPPKAVSWHELRLAPGPYGWSAAVTIDV
jgi:SHS2 domain-containing protein